MSTDIIERSAAGQPQPGQPSTAESSGSKSSVSKPFAKPSAAKSWLKAIELTSRVEADPRRLFADVVEDHAARQPDAPALMSDAETLSYADLAGRINRYARWAMQAGIAAGDTVCILMPNRPDYVAAWLGITKVGGVAALINTKLVGQSLSHCINIAAADHVILASELAATFETAVPYLNRVPDVWIRGGEIAEAGEETEIDKNLAGKNLDEILDRIDGSPLAAAERQIGRASCRERVLVAV